MAGVLITMADDRTRLAQDVERELREHLPARVFKTVVLEASGSRRLPAGCRLGARSSIHRVCGLPRLRGRVLASGLPMAEPAVITPRWSVHAAASLRLAASSDAMALPFSATCVLAMLGFRSSMITTLGIHRPRSRGWGGAGGDPAGELGRGTRASRARRRPDPAEPRSAQGEVRHRGLEALAGSIGQSACSSP